MRTTRGRWGGVRGDRNSRGTVVQYVDVSLFNLHKFAQEDVRLNSRGLPDTRTTGGPRRQQTLGPARPHRTRSSGSASAAMTALTAGSPMKTWTGTMTPSGALARAFSASPLWTTI